MDIEGLAQRSPAVHEAYTKLMDVLNEDEGDSTYSEVELHAMKIAFITGAMSGIELTCNTLPVYPGEELMVKLLDGARARALIYRAELKAKFEGAPGSSRSGPGGHAPA
jgi:hypothetical protein